MVLMDVFFALIPPVPLFPQRRSKREQAHAYPEGVELPPGWCSSCLIDGFRLQSFASATENIASPDLVRGFC